MRICSQFLILAALLVPFVGCDGGGGGGGGSPLSQVYAEALASPNPEDSARRLMSVAGEQTKAGDVAGAERSITDAARRAGEIQDDSVRAGLFANIAHYQATYGLRTEAKNSLREAQRASEKLEPSSNKATMLGQVGVVYSNLLTDDQNGRYWLSEAENVAKGLADPALRAEALVRVARQYNRLKDETQKQEASRLAQASLDAADTIAEPRAKAEALAEVGASLDQMKRSEDAASAYERAGEAARAIPDDISKAFALTTVAEKMGKARGAEAGVYLNEARGVAERIRDEGLKTEVQQKIIRIGRTL